MIEQPRLTAAQMLVMWEDMLAAREWKEQAERYRAERDALQEYVWRLKGMLAGMVVEGQALSKGDLQ